MRKFTLLLGIFAVLGLFSQGFAQIGCGGGRYTQEIFSGVDVTSDITYGSNINLQGNNQSLELDIYEPQGDTEPLRPLLIMAHGGSFIGGSKTQQDITSLVNPLARMGYVCASIEYRLGMNGLPFPGPDSSDATESVVRGYHDMKAAVRWFYKSAQNGNPYKIDTNSIMVGGVSAGAFLALHLAYLDDISEMPAYVDTTQAGLGGGIEGTSGNPGYSSEIIGVVNICGALGDSTWINPGDEPLVSLHGNDDDVVPYGRDLITVAGVYPIMIVDGSASVHDAANRVGLNNCFYTYEGAPHTPHIGDAAYLDTTLNVITRFMEGLLCGSSSQCGYVVSNEQPTPSMDFFVKVYPNPAQDRFYLEAPAQHGVAIQMTDLNGRMVRAIQLEAGTRKEINRTGLPAGMYILQGTSESAQWTGKILLD